MTRAARTTAATRAQSLPSSGQRRMTTIVAHAAEFSACPEGKEYPGASDTGSSTIGRARWKTYLAPSPIIQASIIVPNAHHARVRMPLTSHTHRQSAVPTM